LSKRLKRKIKELSGLDTLSKLDRTRRAKEILNDTAEKQLICNSVLGASFKDVEKVMKEVLNERKLSRHELEYEELLSDVPEKINPEIASLANNRQLNKTPMDLMLDQDEVNRLINESSTQIEDKLKPISEESYPTYSLEEVAALLEGNYHPSMFSYIKG
jgi:hypothetical protein